MVYNKELTKRFISDYKLPIAIFDEKYFNYFINLYEKEFGSLTKYNTLCNLIDKRFNGSAQEFLNYYYYKRDKIITQIESSNPYIEFNNMDMNRYRIVDKVDCTANNIYNQDNCNSYFVSIDLKKANFQAFNYVDKNILLNSNTYEEFIGNFTDIDYIKESKYTRQVIFGKLNPKRQITIEKYITNKLYHFLKNVCSDFNILKCVSLSNDEIIFKFPYISENENIFKENVDEKTSEELSEIVQKEMGISTHISIFQLKRIELTSDTIKRDFFIKKFICDDKMKFCCVPSNFFAIIYKLYNHIPLQEEDYHFIYEGIDCKYCQDFCLNIK